MLNKNGVLILDFGSQYTQLIARRIRENNVYSEILSSGTSAKEILHKKASAIILSGGPNSVYGDDAPNFDEQILSLNIPILGICYGLQLLVYKDGGIVSSSGEGEYGSATININKKKGLFSDIDSITEVWMSHGDKIEYTTNDWEILATSSNGVIAAVENKTKNWVATQFHPEVSHSTQGDKIISNFLFKIADCKPSWTAGNFIQEQVLNLKKKIGDKKVLVGVSGGVDSTVVAALLHKAIGENSISVMIDHGLLRKNEALNCVQALQKGLGLNIKSYDESDLFLSKLKSITAPEKKRKIIGNEFIYSFERISKSLGEVEYLAQGTLYPDIVESGFSKSKKAHVIKSHHNVGGLPEKMDFELIEPLKELFKDEVRKVGLELGLPPFLVNRHPFPGPGLGVRIIGEINESRIKILQEADQIYMDILIEDELYDDIWQAFAVLIPIKTVGVMGDKRTYEYLLGIRAVTSQDGMTADWFRMPPDTLSKISNRIVNNVEGINRVVYDITSKPPGTIEWE